MYGKRGHIDTHSPSLMSLRHVYHVGSKWRGAEFYTAKQREIGRVLWTLADAWMVPRLRSVIPEAFLGGNLPDVCRALLPQCPCGVRAIEGVAEFETSKQREATKDVRDCYVETQMHTRPPREHWCRTSISE